MHIAIGLEEHIMHSLFYRLTALLWWWMVSEEFISDGRSRERERERELSCFYLIFSSNLIRIIFKVVYAKGVYYIAQRYGMILHIIFFF